MVKVYRTLIFCLAAFIIHTNCQAQKIYFSDNGVLKRMNLNGTGVETILPSAGDYIAVDPTYNFLFHNNTQQTYRTRLDGSSPVMVTDDGPMAGYTNLCVIPDYESIIYLGVTDDQDDMYLGSYYDDETVQPAKIVNGIDMLSGDEEYLDIAYNPAEERIYFTGYDRWVYSSGYNGAGYAVLSNAGDAYGPIGVDYDNGKVYWVRETGPNFFIISANLDGTSPNPILSNSGDAIVSLEVYPEQNAVFFAQSDGIYRTTLNGVGGKSLVLGGTTNVTSIAIDSDVTPPIYYALSPADGASLISTTSDLELTFSEEIKISNASPGTTDEFSFRIYKTTGNVLIETIDRSSPNISISGQTVTIDPTSVLEYNTDYYVLVGNKTIMDFTGNNWIGITGSLAWNFKTTFDPSVFYSRANGAWNAANTWSHESHTGVIAGETPGAASDVIIGSGHTVTLTSNTNVVANTTTGTWIKAGGTLNAGNYALNIRGTLNVEGQLQNGGILTGDFDLRATGNIPIFDEIQYGVTGTPNTVSNIYTHVVALNGIQSINGGTIALNGFQICVPPTPSPTAPLFSDITPTSMKLSWTAGGGQAFVVAREGSTGFTPAFGQAYNANAAFGSGDAVGTGNFLVYSGAGNTVSITGLTPDTYYEFDLYSYSTSIGGCYSVENFQLASGTSCIALPAPTGAINAQYCTGDTKPALTVNPPDPFQEIRWYATPTGGNPVNGDFTGGTGAGEVFIPVVPSGTFYAETYDVETQCASVTRTPATLTLHPALAVGTPSANQVVCSGGDPVAIDGGIASGGTGAYTYQWESSTASAGPYSTVGGEVSATIDPPAGFAQTTYYRRLTRSSTCSLIGSLVMVSVGPAPSIAGQPVSPEVCEPQSTSLSINAIGSSLGYQWQLNTGSGFVNINDGGVYTGATSNLLRISNSTGLNNVRYQCIVTSGGSCPVTSNAVPLIVNPRPVVVNQTQTICEGIPGSGSGTLDLTALNSAITGGVSGMAVVWFTNAAMTNAVLTPSNASATNNTIFYAGVTNSSTTCTNNATATITVNGKPAGSGSITGPIAICREVEQTYTVTGITNAQRYNWQVSAGLEIRSQNGTTASIQGLSGTSATITVTGENACGAGNPVSLPIEILEAPDLQISAPEQVLVDEPASFSFQSSGGSKSVLWDFGDNATSTEEAPQHAYTTPGNYDVTLTVTADNNCEGTESTNIVVLPPLELNETNIKNVITANGDSQNGYLYIESIEKFPANQVVLLDRWGVEVFKKDSYNNDWDARRNGEFLPPGQYVCVVKLNETGKIVTRTVSVIKR